MLMLTPRKSISIPNSLALVAAAVIAWGASGSNRLEEQSELACSVPETTVTAQQDSGPALRAVRDECPGDSEQQAVGDGESAVLSVGRTVSLRLLYLPVRALLQ